MALEIGTHTIILLAGPSQSGKSTWSNYFKEKINELNDNMRVAIISSDETRRELLDNDLHRYDPKMMEASEAAFDLLFAKLHASVRFPINTEFVIVDTTGLDADFRQKVAEVAKEHNYRTAIVMFDYPTGEYFQGLSGNDKTIVSKHVDNFKKKVLPNIKKKQYNYHFTVKGKNEKFFEQLEVVIEDLNLWEKSHIFGEKNAVKTKKHRDDVYNDIAIIGDVHEHVDALQSLIEKIGKNKKLVFVGDLFDKGSQTIKMLDYAEQLIKEGAIVVRGNHESFVARRLKGQVSSIANENELFPSLPVFKGDEQLARRFLALYEETLPFLCIHNRGKTIYVTHAPCYNKMLGKLDEQSQKFQRNFYFSNRNPEQMEKDLEFIGKEAKFSHPLHVFGHVANDLKEISNKNKYWLDTGAVYGNRLSALLISEQGDIKVVSQKTTALTEGTLFGTKNKYAKIDSVNEGEENNHSVLSTNKDGNLTTYESDAQIDIESLMSKYNLSPEDKYWLHAFKESGAKFISGTMSPSRSTRELLEPIDTALQYFQSKNIDSVIIEPKYMGSRMQVYLHRDKTKDFAVTRSGTRAAHNKMLQKVFDDWHIVLDNDLIWTDKIVLDGELLPWSAIGKELIEKEFVQYGKSIEKEWELLSSDSNFNNFATKIGIDIPTEQKAIKTFMKQVDLYGSDYPVEYKPFSVLSVDNQLWVYKNQQEIFTWLLPNERYKVINLSDENARKDANDFFTSLTEQLDEKSFAHEGVVVKPLIYEDGVAPYMKVRNENYLHIIYGYDYLKKYQEKVSNKKINRKLELSVKEYELGLKMLTSSNEKELLELACELKFEINKEKELDTRL